jgi:hypothetical protein
MDIAESTFPLSDIDGSMCVVKLHLAGWGRFLHKGWFWNVSRESQVAENRYFFVDL